MKKILFIEDQIDFQASVKMLLGDQHQVLTASNAEEGFNLLQKHNVRLILLDIGLPDQNGFSFLARIRDMETLRDVPVVFLTAQHEVENRVKGFSFGALDYIVKPFEPREFKARIEAHLNRAIHADAQKGTLTRGRFHLDRARRICRIRRNSSEEPVELELTPYEFEVLFYLLKNQGTVIPREQLMKDIWRNVNVLSRTVDRHISSLRKKLDPTQESLEAVHGRGYVLTVKPAAGAA